MFISVVASRRALRLPEASAGTRLFSCNRFNMLLYLWSVWQERIGALVQQSGLDLLHVVSHTDLTLHQRGCGHQSGRLRMRDQNSSKHGMCNTLTQLYADRVLWYVFCGWWFSVLLNAGPWSTARWWVCLVLGASLLPGKSCSKTIWDCQPNCNYYISADGPVYDQDIHWHVQSLDLYVLSLPWRSWKL